MIPRSIVRYADTNPAADFLCDSDEYFKELATFTHLSGWRFLPADYQMIFHSDIEQFPASVPASFWLITNDIHCFYSFHVEATDPDMVPSAHIQVTFTGRDLPLEYQLGDPVQEIYGFLTGQAEKTDFVFKISCWSQPTLFILWALRTLLVCRYGLCWHSIRDDGEYDISFFPENS
jgi:hypothetical protein